MRLQLRRCAGSCNTLNDLSNKVNVPYLSVFNMITKINGSKTVTKYIS